jgi:hypothetical protein
MKSFKKVPSVLVLALLVVFASRPVSAQTQPSQDNQPVVQPSDIPQTPSNLTQPNQYTPAELTQFGQFLDSHPDISRELVKNPALVNDSQFMANHPELQTFLQSQPAIRASIMQNPAAFMAQEATLDSREDTTHADMELLNQFLDDHADFALEVRSDPALVNDGQFLQNNLALLTFLGEHPSIRAELKQDPGAFSRQRYIDETAAERTRDAHRNLVNFRVCLDSNPEVARELKKNPALATDSKFIDRHPEFEDYLSDNPGVSAALTQDPQTFVKAAEQLNPGTTGPQMISCIPTSYYK